MSLATLGPITFEVSATKIRTWQDARRSGEARWHDHDVHLAKPLPEFRGPGLDTFTLTVRLDITKGLVPRDELRQMRKARDEGEVLEFVIGGELVGDYTIRSLNEMLTRFDAKGVLTTAVVEISLKEYV